MPNDKRNKFAKFFSENLRPEGESGKEYFDRVERVLNSRAVTKAIESFDYKEKSVNGSRSQPTVKASKTLVSRFLPPEEIEALPHSENAEKAFEALSSLPALKDFQEQLSRLRKRITLWEQQGVDLKGKAGLLHAVIFTKKPDFARKFARHYQNYLAASGVVGADSGLFHGDGDSHRSMWSLEALNGCVCLVANAKELSYHAAKELESKMRSQNVAIVLSYVGEGESLHESLNSEDFVLNIRLVTQQAPDPVGGCRACMKEWLENKFGSKMQLEGGMEGPYAESFLKKIMEEVGEHNEKKMKATVDRELTTAVKRQNDRVIKSKEDTISEDALWCISREDLFGEAPSIENLNSNAWVKLDAMVGLHQVKESVKSVANSVMLDHHRKMYGQKTARTGLSRLFLGPPGTGKTQVAGLYGQILCNLKVLSKGNLVSKKAADFIGTHIGQTEEKTKKILSEAKGKVLFIDEAYMLDPVRGRGDRGNDPYRQAAIDTLVGEVQNSPDEDICVILAGYRDQMENMIKNANPGLARRFPLADAFVFQEFDHPTLERVLDYKMKEEQLTMTDDAKRVALELLELAKQRDNFGNGGEVVNVIGRALTNYRTRFGAISVEQRRSEGPTCFTPQDFDPDWQNAFRVAELVPNLFDGLDNVDQIKNRFVSLAQRVAALRDAGHDPSPFTTFHFAFTGPPGTGKTAVAHRMGWLFNAMRLIPTTDVIRVSARELIETRLRNKIGSMLEKPKDCYHIMEEAKGKVLVVDEAHRLFGHENDQMKQVVQQLREEFADALNASGPSKRVVVILTGLSPMIGRMLDTNPALGSKFSPRLIFPGLNGDETFERLRQALEMERVNIDLATDQELKVKRAFAILCRSSEWAHYRDVKLIANEIIGATFEKFGTENANPSVTGEDVLQCLRRKYPKALAGQDLDSTLETDESSSSRDIELSREQQGLGVDLNGGAVKSQDSLQGVETAPTPPLESIGSPPLTLVMSEPYQYQKLPIGEYIRILRLQPSRNWHDPLVCKLEAVPIRDADDQPPYFDALSYVWEGQEKAQTVTCDDKPLRVTLNCEAALRHLRRRESQCGLFVDAICIDQDNLTEKNQQVALFGEIYRSAVHVYIWLGVGSNGDAQALTRIQKLCCLHGDWDKNEPIQKLLFRKYQGSMHDMTRSWDLIMKHSWWTRMWTFQEFVLARRPVFVVGNVKLSWDDLVQASPFVAAPSLAQEEGMTKQQWRQARKYAVINKLMPEDCDAGAQAEEIAHRLPLYLEAMDAYMCRLAYQERLREDARPLFMSHFLLKTRNRQAQNPRDKVYGLYYLFQASGFTLPPIDYKQTVAQVYTGVALALLQESESWWLLAHILNKRAQSAISMPSWVPDFSGHALWHQRYNIGFAGRGLDKLEEQLEHEQAVVSQRRDKPFLLKEVEGRLLTSAVFLWEVVETTNEMPSNPVLDRSFDETFELTDHQILQEAVEDFLFVLGGWIKTMEPTDKDKGAWQLRNAAKTQLTDKTEELDLDTQVLNAIALAFTRMSVESSLERKAAMKDVIDVQEAVKPEIDDSEENDAKLGLDGKVRMEAIDLVRRVLANVRACIYPDAAHPCRICGTTSAHRGNEAVQHVTQWIAAQGGETLTYLRYWLYSRAVDHALFKTNASSDCGGHFGFCRNLPRSGDEVVLLPGLLNPVIVRKREPDVYQIIGVTTGMVGLPVYDSNDKVVEGAFCFGNCPSMANMDFHESREFFLV